MRVRNEPRSRLVVATNGNDSPWMSHQRQTPKAPRVLAIEEEIDSFFVNIIELAMKMTLLNGVVLLSLVWVFVFVVPRESLASSNFDPRFQSIWALKYVHMPYISAHIFRALARGLFVIRCLARLER